MKERSEKNEEKIMRRYLLFKLIVLVLILLLSCTKKDKPVAPDTTPPTITAVVSIDTTKVLVSFSESVKPEMATDTLNYFIQSYETLDVHLVEIDPMKKNCILITEPQESTFYDITISQIEDLSGNQMVDTSLSFQGVGVQVDSFRPSVHITDPQEGDTLYGFEYIVATAGDNMAVKKVSFFFNDSFISEDWQFPYYMIFDVRNFPEGEVFSIYATAEDYSANIGYSESLDVFIGYHPPFPYVIIDTIYADKTPYRVDATDDGTGVFFIQNHKYYQPEIDDLSLINVQSNAIERTTHFTTGAAFYLDVFENTMVYFTTGHSFSIYDILLDQIIETVDLGTTATGIRRVEDKLYIARNPSEDIIIYSLQSNSIIDSIPLSGSPTSLAVDTVHNELYVSLYSQDMIAVIDTDGDSVITNISLSGSPWEIIFSPDYSRAFISEINTSEIGVIETSSHTVLNEVSVQGLTNPKGMTLSDDGIYLYVTGMSNEVLVVNTTDFSVEWSFQVGMTPYSIVYTSTFRRVYVSCLGNESYSGIFCIGE